ncbi:cation transporter [Candidatus Nomurabacteria bacterium]|uniref:Cation transporter n=1 Tax=Candidatus Dojkabacteria bacterium TaxID=2099670 RepID=A0A955I9P4_9BACT|nr:cation transporter [Candidatus Dojkabacteria bacterium]MCB9789546.1 cation transporter [Candidatus Nomurabacteria bacterium]
MKKTLNIQGMHCDACISLIKMELEEVGIAQDSVSIRVDSLNSRGVLTLADIEETQLEKAVERINSLGSYQVL